MEKGMREGERLIEFCKERSLIIGNTWFENPKRRLYTWKSPGNRYRKQIDYILIEERFKNGMKRVCTLPGVDIDSDHNLLMAEVNFRMKKVHKGNRRKKWNLEKLKGKSQVVGEKIAERIKFKSRTDEEGKKRYRKLNNELRRKTEKAREKWLEEECEEIEELEKKGRTDLMYKRVKQATWDKKCNVGRKCEIEDKNEELEKQLV